MQTPRALEQRYRELDRFGFATPTVSLKVRAALDAPVFPQRILPNQPTPERL